MKKRLIPLLLSLSLLSSCAAGAAEKIQKVPDVPGEVHVSTDLDVEGKPYESYAAFGLELLRRSRTEGENALLSPLSAALALGMTANGANGETAKEFEATFGMDVDTLNSLCANMTRDYTSLGGSTEANIVNSLWCDPRLTLDDLFAARCRQIYNAELFYATLSEKSTVDAVNDWVKEATNGLIPKTVEKFSPDAVLALVNALYLKNKFQRPFEEPHSEWTIDFTNADGTVSQPRGMSNGERNEQYLARDKGQGVVLPYDDGRLGLLLMLPDEGVSLTDYLNSWDGSTIAALLENKQERLVSLTVPKYELEWDGSLSAPLQAMGLTGAFDVDKADFTAMGTADGPLYIGDVIHKTVLKVNEEGTEAAAVTAVMMDCGAAMPPDDLVILTFDRPFVCGIVDLENGAPLFLGTVEKLS